MADDRPSPEKPERPRETPEELVGRLDALEHLLRSNSARLTAIEQRLGLDWRVAGSPAEAQPADRVETAGPATSVRQGASGPPTDTTPRVAPPAEAAGGSEANGTGDTAAGAEGAGAGVGLAEEPRAGDDRPPAAAPRDFESVVGGSWFNWIGILAVALGVGFFLKLAFENEWIGPAARVTLGAAVGVGLLALGERLRGRGLRQYASVLSGGGFLILYLSTYAAFNFYQLINQPVAFLLMAGVTAGAVLLSVRLDALPVAIVGLIGGFLTPVLLSTGSDNQVALFTYVALLDAGVLAVAYFKRWNSLNLLSFAATALMTLGWLVADYGEEKLWTTLFFLSFFFFLYSMLAVIHNLLPRRPAHWFDALLVSANTSFHCGLGYLLLIDAGYERRLPATAAVVVSAFFLLLFYAAWRLHRAERLLAYVYVGAAVTLFTAALGIQYELYWVTIVWAIEGLMLTWAGLRALEPAARRAGLCVFALAALHWLAWDVPDTSFRAGADFVPLLNRRSLAGAALVAALATAAWLYRRGGEGRRAGSEEWRQASAALVVAANLLAVVALSAEATGYFEARIAAAREQLPAPPLFDSSYDDYTAAASEYERASRPLRDLELARQLSLSLVWAVYGAGLLLVGRLRGSRLLRVLALGLLGLTTLKVFVWDLSSLDRVYRIISFIALGLVLLAVSYLYQKSLQPQRADATD